jgi:hypothetical protein
MALAHRRGNVTERAVLGAIAMARRRGVNHADVQAILASHSLVWDDVAGRVRRLVPTATDPEPSE